MSIDENYKLIARGECISGRGVEHCTICTDCCEASQFKISLNEVTKTVGDLNKVKISNKKENTPNL
jgi:hypothetical protein